MADSGSAYSSAFLAAITRLHEVARPAASSDRPSELTEAEEGQKYFFTKQTQFILDFARSFWVCLKFNQASLRAGLTVRSRNDSTLSVDGVAGVVP
ncbi:MAG: hypothetical protein ACLQAT_03135 [Candidatus Binataceae bacterium]